MDKLNLDWNCLQVSDEFERAETFLKKDLELSIHEGDENGAALTLLDLGDLERARRRYDKARDYYGQALPQFRKELDDNQQKIFHQLQLQVPERLEPIQIQNVVQTAS